MACLKGSNRGPVGLRPSYGLSLPVILSDRYRQKSLHVRRLMVSFNGREIERGKNLKNTKIRRFYDGKKTIVTTPRYRERRKPACASITRTDRAAFESFRGL